MALYTKWTCSLCGQHSQTNIETDSTDGERNTRPRSSPSSQTNCILFLHSQNQYWISEKHTFFQTNIRKHQCETIYNKIQPSDPEAKSKFDQLVISHGRLVVFSDLPIKYFILIGDTLKYQRQLLDTSLCNATSAVLSVI